MKHFEQLLEPILKTLSLALDRTQIELLSRQFDLLLGWNEKINLTSVANPPEIVRRHFGESLFVAQALRAEIGTLVDLGSGAGFPGFPIAVVKPKITVTLVESVRKKAVFLKEIARSVPNVSVFHGRFEDLDFCFDWAVVRGVALDKPLKKHISRQTRNLAVILGRQEASGLSLPGFAWLEPIPIPWEPTRVLMIAGCFT